VFRQRVDKAVVARALEAGDVLETQPVERRGRDLRPRTRHDKGYDLLAPFAMRASDHRNLDEVRMAQQYLLHLARVAVAAAADDHVLRAVAQGEKPVFVKAAEVAGMEPAAA